MYTNENVDFWNIYFVGAACLYYLIRHLGERSEAAERIEVELGRPAPLSLDSLSVPVKQRLMRSLLNSIHRHTDKSAMARNGVLAIWQFKIPEDPALLYRYLILLYHMSKKACPIL